MLDIVSWTDFALLDGVLKSFMEGLGLGLDSVVFVLRFAKADDVALFGDCFLVGDDGVTLLDFALSEVLL